MTGLRRSAAAATASLVVAVLFTGCGGEEPSGGTPEPRPWAVLVPSGLDLDPGLTSLKIAIDSGRCNPPRSALDRIEVHETPGEVEVTPFVRPEGSKGIQDACLSYIPATVNLESALGDRRLIQGSSETAPERYELPSSTHLGEAEARRLRAAVIDGARVDFNAVSSPSGFEQCFLAGFNETLATTTLSSLVDVHQRDGTAAAARALNGIAAPVAATCGGKENVPELAVAARQIGA